MCRVGFVLIDLSISNAYYVKVGKLTKGKIMYVAVSKELIQSIEDKIAKLKENEQNAIEKVPYRIELPSDDPVIMSLVWGQHIALKNMIPHEWKFKANRVDFTTKTVEGQSLEFQVECTTDMFDCPYNKNARDGYQTKYYETNISNDHPMIAEYLAYRQKVSANDLKWKTVKSQVLQFIGQCKSLNEALKLWPDLRLYVKDSYLERIDKKVEKSKDESKALDALKNIDTDLAISAYVGARFAGNSNE